VLLKALEQVTELEIRHICSRYISAAGLDQTARQVLFEPLQVHDLVFNRVSHDKSVDVDSARLADAMGSIHRLQVVHRVPVVLHEDDDVSSSQSQAQAADGRRQDQNANRWVVIELIDDLKALPCAERPQ